MIQPIYMPYMLNVHFTEEIKKAVEDDLKENAIVVDSMSSRGPRFNRNCYDAVDCRC